MKRRLVPRGIVEIRIAPPRSTRSPSADGAHTGRPVTMEIIGLDLHKRERQRSIKADDGTITDRRIATSRERCTAVFGERPPARILLEASTEREWVARHLESLDGRVRNGRSCAPGRGTSRSPRRWCAVMGSACRPAAVRGSRRGSPNSSGRRH